MKKLYLWMTLIIILLLIPPIGLTLITLIIGYQIYIFIYFRSSKFLKIKEKSKNILMTLMI